MDELEELYRARSSASVKSKLALLMNLEEIRDARAVPFLLTVLRDRDEDEQVRIYVLKQLRNGGAPVLASNRQAVTDAIAGLLDETSIVDLRLHAALALAEFTDIDSVLSVLGALCLAEEESLDLRYAAFTSLEATGPTPACIALLRRIASDETLGGSAQSVLSAWHLE